MTPFAPRSPSTTTRPVTTRRKSSMAAVAAAKIPACNRCRLRKTKCDAQLPACTPCQKAGIECHGEDHAAGRPVSRSYIWALEQRIKELEASATEAPSGPAAATCSTSPAPAPDVSASSASTGTSASARPEYGAAPSASMTSAVVIPTTPARGDSSRGARPRGVTSHSEGGAGRSARHSSGSHARKRPRHDGDGGDDDENDDDDDEDGNDNEHDEESDGIQSRRRSVVENDFYRPPQHDPLSRLVQAALQDAETDTSRSSPGPNGGESGEDGDGIDHQEHQHRQKQQHDQQQPQDQLRRHAAVAQVQPDNGPHPPTKCTAAGPSPSLAQHQQQQQQQQQRQGTSAMPLPNGDTRRSWLDRELAALSALRATVSRQVRRLSVKDRFEPARYERRVVDAIVRRYFTYMNCPLPCLHEQAFAIQVDDYCTNSSLASPMDRYQLLMVFAVALASLGRAQYLTSETSQLARQFYYAAAAHASHTPRSGWRKLQNVLLQVQYHLLVPNSKDLWRLSGEAMRLVTELGLYAEPRVANPLLADMSKRLFWTTYSIERMLACVYGRPLTLAEDWISVGLPAVVEDKCITSQGIQRGPVCHLKLAHHLHIHARRLQAEIHGRLYTPTSAGGDNEEKEEEEQEELEAWTWKMQGELQRWHESFTVPSPFVTKNWVDLQYHLLTTTLLRPSPRRPNPSMDCLRRALQSSGEVLKIYRRLQRELAINFVGMAIRNLFLSGLTFLHSLQALSQHGGGNEMPLPLIDVVLQVQDCTVVLESLTAYEEVSTARRLRDAFEKASTSVLRLLSQRAGAPSSTSSFSRPPPYFPSNGRAASESTSPHSTASSATATLRGVLTDRDEREHFFAHDIDAAPLPEHPKCPDRRLYAMGNGDTAAASRPTRSASTVAAAPSSATSSSSSWRPSQSTSTGREQVSPRPWATATTPQHAHERPQAQAYAEEQMLLDLAQSQHPQQLQQQRYPSSSSSAAALDMSEYFFQPYFESLGSAPSQLSSSGGGVVSQNSGGSGSSSSAMFGSGGALGGGFDAGSLLMGPPQHPLGNTPDSMSAGRIDFGPGLGSSGGAGPDSGFGLDSLADLFSSPGYA